MTKRIRLTILALAIACFLIIAPVALLYGWGYRYDFRDKMFIQTGAIYLKSLPRKAEVWLAGVEREKKTPLIIDGLLPNKKYEILVELEGFRSWQKTLEVKPTLVTEAKNILLIPENPKIIPLENKSEIEVREFLLSPDKEKLAFSFYTDKENSSGIWILNLKEKDKITLIDNKVLNLEQSYNDFTLLQWSADSNRLLFSAHGSTSSPQEGKTKEKVFFIVDLPHIEVLVRGLEDLSKTILKPSEEDFKKTGVLNLTNITKANPSKILWHGQNPNILLWLAPLESSSLTGQASTKKESSLFQLDLSDSSEALGSSEDETSKIIAKEVIDFAINQNDIYIIKETSIESDAINISGPKYIIYKNNFEVSSIPDELGKPQEIFILEEKGLALKTDEDKTYLLILEDNNPLLGDTPPLFLLAKGVKKIELSPDKNKILYWQDQELKIYFLQKNISYKKEIGDIESINLDFPIEQVLWYKDSEHLIYTQNGTIRITEIDPRGQKYDVEFVEGGSPIYDPAGDVLYFLLKGNLYKVEFPTKTGIIL